MKKRSYLVVLMVAWLVVAGFTAGAVALDDVSEIRCSGAIAEIGDQQYDFQQKCGPPTTTQENGQVWIYDRRPEDFIYYVTFDEDRAERMQVGSGN